MNTNAIYVYKMVADNGGAPCIWRGLLSLALCKPKIRKGAEKGALIFGFGGRHYEERLIYIAQVTSKRESGAYYREWRFGGRPDCIYHDVGGKARRKPGATNLRPRNPTPRAPLRAKAGGAGGVEEVVAARRLPGGFMKLAK